MLEQYLIVRLQRINTMLASGVEEKRLDKARRKLEILMRNSMEDLRTLGLAKKVFPKLRMVIGERGLPLYFTQVTSIPLSSRIST